jgi:hypothetical protein
MAFANDGFAKCRMQRTEIRDRAEQVVMLVHALDLL